MEIAEKQKNGRANEKQNIDNSKNKTWSRKAKYKTNFPIKFLPLLIE
jgi:hypothetical protein